MTSDSCDVEIRVRYAEVDQMGFLHHSRYWVYCEIGRTELLRRTGMTYRQCEDAGIRLVVVKAAITYLAPAHYDDLLVVTTQLKKMGQVKMQHTYEIRRAGEPTVLARAETTLGCVDAEGKITPIPEILRKG